ncbi:MAG: NAD-dependent malic enzyme [Cruoricaptor ignavus]|nr:NAD-dependent malic enzyme [Cruoricaptor ignavus]
MKNTEQGNAILQNPKLNKGTAFTQDERDRLQLHGLLPSVVETIDDQLKRVNLHLSTKSTGLGQYIYLTSLLDRNETLFFKTLMSDPARFVPIMYDPVVGEACSKFSEIYRDKNGMFISLKDKGRIKEILQNWEEKDIRFICVSSGGRILGLGDLGANGMGIPLGKLQLYTACAAIPPEGLLPLLLDSGTDNETLLQDEFYIGLRENRPSTQELDEFVKEFVDAVQEVFPKCCIHFEDWKGTDAIRLLAEYKDKVLCYNDDIQGTGAVAVAGLYGALNIINQKMTDQRVLFLGAGSAGVGIANMITEAMKLEGDTEEQAVSKINLFDVNGLLETSRTDLSDVQKRFAKDNQPTKNFVEAIKNLKPTIIIGVSTIGKAFTKEVVETLSELNERPIIFSLSNPTEHAECSAEEAYTWSNGKAVYCAGVPFDEVNINGKTFFPGQANNFYCFPGVSLAIYATQPKRVTDSHWITSAKTLAGMLTQEEKEKGMVLPPQSDILEVSLGVAEKVAEAIFNDGLAQVSRPENIREWLKGMQYQPVYQEF